MNKLGLGILTCYKIILYGTYTKHSCWNAPVYFVI